MKGLIIFLLVSVGLGRLLSREQFLEATSGILHAGNLNPVKVRCDEQMAINESGQHECYAISVGNAKYAVVDKYLAPAGSALRVHSPTTDLWSALYFSEGSMRIAEFLSKDVDFVLAVMRSDPRCRVVYYNLEKLADSQVGPGSVSITSANVDKRSHGWRVGATVKYKSPAEFLFGGGEIEANGDYSGSIETSLETAIGLSFEIPKDATCTPHLIQYSLLCDRVEGLFVFSKNTSVIFSRHVPSANNPVILPFVKGKSPTFFETVVGCIDEAA